MREVEYVRRAGMREYQQRVFAQIRENERNVHEISRTIQRTFDSLRRIKGSDTEFDGLRRCEAKCDSTTDLPTGIGGTTCEQREGFESIENDGE